MTVREDKLKVKEVMKQ